MTCQLEEYPKLNRCCCNCKDQVELKKHPTSTIPELKGSILTTAGYGCASPELSASGQGVFFFGPSKHGLCEAHRK